MKEELLHYVWRVRNILPRELITTAKNPVYIQDWGHYNHHDGPDFLEAKIQLQDITWAGNIEMHIKASDWYAHNHEMDPAYDNVILHVVWEDDQPIFGANQQLLPTVVLKPYVPLEVINNYDALMANETWVPCANHVGSVDPIHWTGWKERLTVERLSEKTTRILNDLERTQYNWEEVFLQHLAMHLGTQVNKEAFDLLMRSIPFAEVLKIRDDLFQLESLFFGQAGLIDGTQQDDYPKRLYQEYQFLQKKLAITPMSRSIWKFMRLRPPNFPTIRIAQLARLVFQQEHLFSKCLAAQNSKELHNAFQLTISQYWKNHFVWDKSSPRSQNKSLGRSTIDNLIINTIAPFLFIYGRSKGDDQYIQRALDYLKSTPLEKNTITNHWRELGVVIENAFDSQALIQLKNKYCHFRRCTSCQIGHRILKLPA